SLVDEHLLRHGLHPVPPGPRAEARRGGAYRPLGAARGRRGPPALPGRRRPRADAEAPRAAAQSPGRWPRLRPVRRLPPGGPRPGRRCWEGRGLMQSALVSLALSGLGRDALRIAIGLILALLLALAFAISSLSAVLGELGGLGSPASLAGGPTGPALSSSSN